MNQYLQNTDNHIELMRNNSTEIQHQLIEMGFEISLINNILLHYEIISLEQALEYLTKENGKWNHPYLNLQNDDHLREILCVICRDVPENHTLNFLKEAPISLEPITRNSNEINLKDIIDIVKQKSVEFSEIFIRPDSKLCNICLGPLNSNVSLECSHEYCYSCFNDFLVNKINNSDVELIECPEGNCKKDTWKILVSNTRL